MRKISNATPLFPCFLFSFRTTDILAGPRPPQHFTLETSLVAKCQMHLRPSSSSSPLGSPFPLCLCSHVRAHFGECMCWRRSVGTIVCAFFLGLNNLCCWLCPLRFPPGLLPCLQNNHHYEIPEQGKGTNDHLLPLGDWFILYFLSLCLSVFYGSLCLSIDWVGWICLSLIKE